MPEITCGLSRNRDVNVDVLVIGGGIMGAGVFRTCAHLGLTTLMVDQGDFASGTSSRSSKMVHGGLHYFSHFQFGLARRACRDRNQLLAESSGLVRELDFFLPQNALGKTPPWVARIVLGAYRHLGGAQCARDPARRYREFPDGAGTGPRVLNSPARDMSRQLGPGLEYTDGVTDDAGLVLRVIREGCRAGGHARNYVPVRALMRNDEGQVCGAHLLDLRDGSHFSVRAQAVVNATGIWADQLRGSLGNPPRLGFLRGSHLIFSRDRVPLQRAVVATHPETGRPAYLVPWQGVTLLGSTSVHHTDPLGQEPRIARGEARHLLNWAQWLLPSLQLSSRDVLSTFAGVRAIVDPEPNCPSDASRACMVTEEDGLISVTGGKLTTFPSMAAQVTRLVERRLPGRLPGTGSDSILDRTAMDPGPLPLPRTEVRRLLGRYGERGLDWVVSASRDERNSLPGLPTTRAEVRWTVREEGVHHLDDLLLRRLRIGLTHPRATERSMDAVRGIIKKELGWSDGRWREEAARYGRRMRESYAMPPAALPERDGVTQASPPPAMAVATGA